MSVLGRGWAGRHTQAGWYLPGEMGRYETGWCSESVGGRAGDEGRGGAWVKGRTHLGWGEGGGIMVVDGED